MEVLRTPDERFAGLADWPYRAALRQVRRRRRDAAAAALCGRGAARRRRRCC